MDDARGSVAGRVGLQKKRAPLIPVTIAPGSRNNFQQLLTSGKPLSDPSLPDGHTHYYRSDDVAAVAYFYLDKPGGVLPPIAASAERRAALRPAIPKKIGRRRSPAPAQSLQSPSRQRRNRRPSE